MQTSARTKAKTFWKKYNQGMNGSEYDIDILERLLLEHERDTRYTAIDILRSLDTYEVQTEDTVIIERRVYQDGVELEEAVSAIHNLKVGN